MRRRILSAAFPVHRHAFPQIAVDAVLVALAYYLAYRLRFDAGVPPSYQLLYERTIVLAPVLAVAVFIYSGLYRHWMRYSSQADYLRIAQAAAISPLVLLGAIAVLQPSQRGTREGFVTLFPGAGVIVVYALLTLLFLGGTRYLVHLFYERPLRGYRAQKGASSVADRRRRRRRAARAARDPAQPGPQLPAGGFRR